MANRNFYGYWIVIARSFYCCCFFHTGLFKIQFLWERIQLKSCFKVISISLQKVQQQNKISNVLAGEEALTINSVVRT